MKPGDEVWVKGVVTRVRGEKVSVAFRVANRVGSTYPGSSTTNKVIDGVVRRTTEVPAEDVKPTDEAADEARRKARLDDVGGD